ncbi:hypothetical protein FOZ61_008006 [Perkinsus olseni]|nr:hypothetical protein FOZ61_008006 [Perkinsus olseni]
MNKHDLPYATTVIAVGMSMSVYLSGCYSYGGINVRRFGVGSPEATATAADHVASTVHEDRCYAEVFGMQVAFTSTQAAVDDGVYQGVEIKCGNHLVNLNDVEGYPLMKDNLLRIEGAHDCNDVHNTLHHGHHQMASIPTSQMYHQLEVVFKTMKSICSSGIDTTPRQDGSLCYIPYMDGKGEVTLKYSEYNDGYMFHSGQCLNAPIDGNKFIKYSHISKKISKADIPSVYMGIPMTCDVIKRAIDAPRRGSDDDLNSRQMEGICKKMSM